MIIKEMVSYKKLHPKSIKRLLSEINAIIAFCGKDTRDVIKTISCVNPILFLNKNKINTCRIEQIIKNARINEQIAVYIWFNTKPELLCLLECSNDVMKQNFFVDNFYKNPKMLTIHKTKLYLKTRSIGFRSPYKEYWEDGITMKHRDGSDDFRIIRYIDQNPLAKVAITKSGLCSKTYLDR